MRGVEFHLPVMAQLSSRFVLANGRLVLCLTFRQLHKAIATARYDLIVGAAAS